MRIAALGAAKALGMLGIACAFLGYLTLGQVLLVLDGVLLLWIVASSVMEMRKAED